MSADLGALLAVLEDALIGLDPASSAGRLMFGAIGTVIDPAEFEPTSPNPPDDLKAAWRIEVGSELVDPLPLPAQTQYCTGLAHLSEQYQELAFSAIAPDQTPPAVAQNLNRVVADARQKLDYQRQPTVTGLGAGTYLPTELTPPFWFNRYGAHWTHYSSIDTGAPPIMQWRWRLPRFEAPLAPAATRPVSFLSRDPHALEGELFSWAVGDLLDANLDPNERRLAARALVNAIRTPTDLTASGLSRHWREALPDLLSATRTTGVADEVLTLELDYCPVVIRRDWMHRPLLLNQSWAVPGTLAGSYCANDPTVLEQTIPCIPTAFIAVKDVSITVDVTGGGIGLLPDALGMGPFALVQANTFSGGTLQIPGMQVIAWRCVTPPRLPPQSP